MKDLIIKISKGNPGALRVCMEAVKAMDGDLGLQLFDANKLYGSKLWVAYKDFAEGDVVTLLSAISLHSDKLWDIVNRYKYEPVGEE